MWEIALGCISGNQSYVVVVVLAIDSLKKEGKALLQQYGSAVVNKLEFRDAFAMVGQRGLSSGSAIEKVPHISQRGPLHVETL